MLWFIMSCVVMYICYTLGKRNAAVAAITYMTHLEQHGVIDKKRWNELVAKGILEGAPYPNS